MSGPARKADTRNGKWNYERRRPEQTLLYRLVAEHYPRFLALLADQGRSLPHYVQREFDDFLRCGILEHGFLRVQCQECHSERLVGFSWSLLRFPAPATLVIPFTSQTARFLPQLWRPPDGRKRRAAGRRGPAPTAHAPMGAELSLPVAVPVCEPTRDHEPGSGPRLPGHRDPSHPAGRVYPCHRQVRRRHADPALWKCLESQRSLPHAIFGWGVSHRP